MPQRIARAAFSVSSGSAGSVCPPDGCAGRRGVNRSQQPPEQVPAAGPGEALQLSVPELVTEGFPGCLLSPAPGVF